MCTLGDVLIDVTANIRTIRLHNKCDIQLHSTISSCKHFLSSRNPMISKLLIELLKENTEKKRQQNKINWKKTTASTAAKCKTTTTTTTAKQEV